MFRLVPALPLMLLATTAAFAQTAPEEATKDLWCGTAFTIAFNVELAPPGTPEAELEQGRQLYAAGVQLIARGEAAHLAAGFTAEAVAQLKADLVPDITAQIQSGESVYTFEECSVLAATVAPADGAASSESAATPSSESSSASAESSSLPVPSSSSSSSAQ